MNSCQVIPLKMRRLRNTNSMTVSFNKLINVNSDIFKKQTIYMQNDAVAGFACFAAAHAENIKQTTRAKVQTIKL